MTVLLLSAGSAAYAQANSKNFGFGQFSPPPLKKAPVSGMLTLTPTSVQPIQAVDLGPQAISLGKSVTPSEVKLNQVTGPAPAMPGAKPQVATDTVADQKPTGIWAPPPTPDWLSVKHQPATSFLEKTPTPTGLGNTSLNQEPDIDWRVVTPVDVPITFVPLTAPKPKQEPNHWINPPPTGPKKPKYQWK